MHVLTSLFVACVGLWQPLDNLADCVQSVAVGVHRSNSRNVCLDSVGQCVHTSVSNKLNRHAVSELRVNNCDVRGNLEVSDWVLNALLVIGNDGECGYLSCGTGSRRNCAEVSLGAELRKTKDLAHVLKSGLWVLVLDPHSFSCVDWGAAADSNDPVWLELGHLSSTAHNGLDGRIGLDALNVRNLKTCGLEVILDVIKEAAATHGAAARNDNCPLTLEVLNLVTSALAKIQIAWICKTSHKPLLNYVPLP